MYSCYRGNTTYRIHCNLLCWTYHNTALTKDCILKDKRGLLIFMIISIYISFIEIKNLDYDFTTPKYKKLFCQTSNNVGCYTRVFTLFSNSNDINLWMSFELSTQIAKRNLLTAFKEQTAVLFIHGIVSKIHLARCYHSHSETAGWAIINTQWFLLWNSFQWDKPIKEQKKRLSKMLARRRGFLIKLPYLSSAFNSFV